MTSTETDASHYTTVLEKDETEITLGRVSGRDVIWKPKLYTITSALKDFGPPILVKVAEGIMIENEALENEEILTIHGERPMQQVQAVDQFDRNLHIPTECIHKFIIRTFSDETYKTIRDMCNAVYLPRMAMNTKLFKFYGVYFDIGTQFQIQSVHMENNEPIGLQVISTSPRKLRLTLPVGVRGDFKEILLPNDREKQYMIKDIANRQLPIAIGFLPSMDKSSLYGPHLGRVILKKFSEVDLISATVHQIGGDVYKTFPRQLDATVRIGLSVSDKHDYSSVSQGATNETDFYVDMKSPQSCGIRENAGEKIVQDDYRAHSMKNKSGSRKVENEYEEDLSLPSATMPIESITDILRQLHLEDYAMAFRENQINTELAKSLRKTSFTSELHMTSFEAMKLYEYLGGWRPMYQAQRSRHCQASENDPQTWTVEEVQRGMKTIQLSTFARFCLNNHVDGPLLMKSVDETVLQSIKDKHNVALTSIEQTRLEQYVKGWRPDP